jgi:hypothetical protein
MDWQDPSDYQYQLRRLHKLGAGGRANGGQAVTIAQLYISQLRTFRRKLAKSAKTSWKDWKKVFRPIPQRHLELWLDNRCKVRIDRANARGESLALMSRRNLFEAGRGHGASHGIAKHRRRRGRHVRHR